MELISYRPRQRQDESRTLERRAATEQPYGVLEACQFDVKSGAMAMARHMVRLLMNVMPHTELEMLRSPDYRRWRLMMAISPGQHARNDLTRCQEQAEKLGVSSLVERINCLLGRPRVVVTPGSVCHRR